MYNNLVVLLHGLGSNGDDMKGLWQAIQAKDPKLYESTLVLTPDAPIRKISYMGGQEMRGWFDLYGLDLASPEDWDGLMSSRESIETQIENALKVHESIKRVIVGGFSQGGALTYMITLLTKRPEIFAGIVMSGWLPARGVDLYSHITDAGKKVPILSCHGTQDQMVQLPSVFAKCYEEAGANVEFKTYQCGHTVIPEEIDDIAEFLRSKLRPQECPAL